MQKADFIALLLEGNLSDDVRIMSATEEIDEYEDPEQLVSVTDRVVGVNNTAVEGVCLILTNAISKTHQGDDED